MDYTVFYTSVYLFESVCFLAGKCSNISLHHLKYILFVFISFYTVIIVEWRVFVLSVGICVIICIYRGADKSLARLISPFILFDGENISFDASLVIYI